MLILAVILIQIFYNLLILLNYCATSRLPITIIHITDNSI